MAGFLYLCATNGRAGLGTDVNASYMIAQQMRPRFLKMKKQANTPKANKLDGTMKQLSTYELGNGRCRPPDWKNASA